jgi:hypothetical protein
MNEVIKTGDGRMVWDLTRYYFIRQYNPAPPTVNPSLWRQSQLVVKDGLYKVVDRLCEVRTADLSNITFVEGNTVYLQDKGRWLSSSLVLIRVYQFQVSASYPGDQNLVGPRWDSA